MRREMESNVQRILDKTKKIKFLTDFLFPSIIIKSFLAISLAGHMS